MNKDYLIRRLEIEQKCNTDPEFLALTMERVKKDTCFFFNEFLLTYDPRKTDKIIPFTLYDYQKDFIHCLDECYINKEHLLVEKSRDMGFSWIVLGFILQKMITSKGFSAGVGSRKMLLVDELGNMKSLMQRIRFMLRYLPVFLRRGYEENKHSKSGLITLPGMESTVSGEAGDDIGRGDRTSVYLIDEFAHIPRSTIVQEAISQTSDFIIYGSTPKGRGNEFSRLRWKTPINRFTMNWKDHPNKDQIWYEKKKETMTDAMIAQEIDISYNKSMEGKVYKWFDQEKHANQPIIYNPMQDIYSTFDWGIGDPTACILFQYYDNIMHIFDYMEVKDTTIDVIFTMVQNRLQKHKQNLKIQNFAACYGDLDGRNRNIITGNSIADFIRQKYGISLRFKLPNIIKNRIMSVRMLGKSGRIKVDKNLGHFIECLENYRYPEKEHGENEKPLHDWTSHACSALEYYCDYAHGMDQFEPDSVIYETKFR